MNYCEKICYAIYKAYEGSFEQMARELFTQLAVENVFRLTFFGSPGNNKEYIEHRTFLQNCAREKFGNKRPVLSYIAQPPLEGRLVVEVCSCVPDERDNIFYKTSGENAYVLLKNDDGRFLFSGGWQADLSTDIYAQSKEIFRQMKDVLDEEGFGIDSIVRQWNYIEQITAQESDGQQHYQMFNNARSEFYSSTLWKDGYPAATGIGSTCGGVLVDFDAVMLQSDVCRITPIDNKLQVAAHAYSENVLMSAGSCKTTPKFERAKSLTLADRRMVYISGTAAIRGEESLTGVGIERQFAITMENISQLTGDARCCLLRVYLKYAHDYTTVKHLLSSMERSIAISYLETDVCRNELLIEIEGIAIE